MDEPTTPPDAATTPPDAATTPPLTPSAPTLRRSVDKRVFGGVAGGISERFDVDVTIVRVVFVVLALLWGLGVVIYLALWVLVSRTAPDPNADVRAEPTGVGRLWLRVALPLGIVVLFVLALSVGHHSPRVGQTVSGLWIAALVVLALIAAFRPSRRLTVRRFAALTLLAFVSFLIVIVGLFFTAVQFGGVPLRGADGQRTWHPVTASEVHAVYHGAIGETRLDLADVSFAPGTHAITATQSVGYLDVIVPADARIYLHTSVGIGTVSDEAGGPDDDATNAPRLDLDLRVGVGAITLERAAPLMVVIPPRAPLARSAG